MTTLREIQQSIAQLPPDARQDLALWLRLQIFKDEERHLRVGEPVLAYGTAPEPQLLTVEEYLRLEETGTVRHEYIAGEVFAMADPTLRHEAIAGNLHGALHAHLRGGPCRPFIAGVRANIKVDRADIFYYPDVVVVCGTLDMEGRFIQNARLVVEVLSPSTERTDRREKALNYRHLPGLEEYVLVAQRRQEVTIYRRGDDWRPRVLATPDAVVELRSVELALPLERVYEGVF